MNGPYFEIQGFQEAKGAFGLGQGFVVAHTGVGGHTLGHNRGADDIDAVKGRFGGNGLPLTRKRERRVLNVQGEVFGHLGAVHDLAHLQADVISPCQASGFDTDLNLSEALFGL